MKVKKLISYALVLLVLPILTINLGATTSSGISEATDQQLLPGTAAGFSDVDLNINSTYVNVINTNRSIELANVVYDWSISDQIQGVNSNTYKGRITTMRETMLRLLLKEYVTKAISSSQLYEQIEVLRAALFNKNYSQRLTSGQYQMMQMALFDETKRFSSDLYINCYSGPTVFNFNDEMFASMDNKRINEKSFANIYRGIVFGVDNGLSPPVNVTKEASLVRTKILSGFEVSLLVDRGNLNAVNISIFYAAVQGGVQTVEIVPNKENENRSNFNNNLFRFPMLC